MMSRTLWVLACKACKVAFTHTEVGRAMNTIELLLPEKPDFAPDGEQLACPHCNAQAVYMSSDLRYHLRLD